MPWTFFFLFVLTLYPCMCTREKSGATESSAEHIPTLRDIFGGIPKHSLPLMHQPWKSLQGITFREPGSHSGPRGLERRRLAGRAHGPASISAQVVAGTLNLSDPQSSWYYAKLQLGTPAQDILMLIDTGSPAFWVQDKNCTQCFEEVLPLFSGALSSTYKPHILIVNGTEEFTFIATYGDGAVNAGLRATDTLTINSGCGDRLVIPDFEFGDSLVNIGKNEIFSGILGLTATNAFVTGVTPVMLQLATLGNGTFNKLSKSFRHCFPDRVNQPGATSFLSFGHIDESETEELFSLHRSKTSWTPLHLSDPLNASVPLTYYVLRMTGIAVAGKRLPIDRAELSFISSSPTGNFTVIDSGTTFTSLRDPYLSMTFDAYAAASPANLPISQDYLAVGVLAFNVSQEVFDASVFPTVSFFFEKWQPHEQEGANHGHGEEVELLAPNSNLFVPIVDDNNNQVFALSILSSGANYNLIGNYWQQNHLIEFDLERKRLGFLRASCAFEK